MFESAELKHKLSDKDYDTEVPKLREALLDAQFDLSGKERSLVADYRGWDRRRGQRGHY
jgi:hypothetical protein